MGPSLFDDAGAGEAPTLTVGELSARIARLTASAFPADLWVSGQMRNLNRSKAGHVYFDLAEPAPAGAPPRTQISVTLLEPERVHVNRQLTAAGGAVRMEDGIEVRIQGRLRWYGPRGVLQFRMHGIDPAFTLGRLQADRDRILAGLAADGLLGANRALAFPVVPLRIGLVTSVGSAAEADVRHELEASGYGFTVVVADARTQGTDCGPSVVRALHRLARARVDVVLLVRGGGARTDLAGFDGDDIARAIASMPVPVLTGIGHEVDRAIADEVAHRAHKTPTAAAAAVVATVAAFLGRVDAAWEASRRAALAAASVADGRLDRRANRVAAAGARALRRHDDRLNDRGLRITRGARRSLDRGTVAVDRAAAATTTRADQALRRAGQALDVIDARLAGHDPVRALARGWSITTTAAGEPVRSVADLAPGTTITTRLVDGTVTSTVDTLSPTAAPDLHPTQEPSQP